MLGLRIIHGIIILRENAKCTEKLRIGRFCMESNYKDNSGSLDLLLDAFDAEQMEAENEKERLREEERKYEEEQRILDKEYEEKQKTAAGRNDAEENIAMLKSLSQKKELAGLKIDSKQYYIREKYIKVSEELIEEGRINRLFSDKARKLISQLFLTDAVKINRVEDITENFFPAVREQIKELCLYYQQLCQKLGLSEKTFEEIYKEFSEEWLDEDFLSEYAEIYENIISSVAQTAAKMQDTEININPTFDVRSMVRYSLMYKGSFSGMIKTDAVEIAQSTLNSWGSRLANSYRRFKLDKELEKCTERFQKSVKMCDRHFAMWCWEMQLNIISQLQNKGMIKKSVDEMASVDAVATYILDDMETDKQLKECDIDQLCDLMLSGDPTNPFVLYLFLCRMPKTDIDEFLRIIDDTGCNDSLIIALNMFCHIEKKTLKVDTDNIIAMSLDERSVYLGFFSNLLERSVRGTFIYEFLGSICKEIKSITEREKREEQRLIENAKQIFPYTPNDELTREFLEKQINFISEVRTEMSKYNSWILNDYKIVFKYTWQVSNEKIREIINKFKIGNEYIFLYGDEYLITDKAWYLWRKDCWGVRQQAFNDIEEIIPVRTYETFLSESKEGVLIRRKNKKINLVY